MNLDINEKLFLIIFLDILKLTRIFLSTICAVIHNLKRVKGHHIELLVEKERERSIAHFFLTYMSGSCDESIIFEYELLKLAFGDEVYDIGEVCSVWFFIH